MLALFTCCAAFGQRKEKSPDNNLRGVEGVVADASGAPVAKAVVQLKDTKSLQIESFITDASGKYHFAGLSADVEYQLKANSEGATSGWKTLSLYNTKKIATMNLKLKPSKRPDSGS